jgi:dTDP-4-amino-4,6-dideoxygalactose transaminase
MYHGGFQCLSFHIKKSLPVGRGGMILTDDKDAYEWFKLARFDGREPVPLREQKDFTVLGWNMYMSPPDAARAVQLFEVIKNIELPDLNVESQKYPDLSQFKIYTQ